MSYDWKKLDWRAMRKSDFHTWADMLTQLISEAQAALTAQDNAERLRVSDVLGQFIDNSPNLLPGISDLDEQALGISNDLLSANIENAINQLAARSVQLISLTKQIDTVAAQVEKKAASIRLDSINNFILSATDIVSSAKALKTSFENVKFDDTLAKQIEGLITQIGDIKTKVQALKTG